jgi:hypothetical protein
VANAAAANAAAANAARLAYFNSPAAAAFMSSMHGLHPQHSVGVNMGVGVSGAHCLSAPNVSGPMSMFHSFASDASSPRNDGCAG